MVAAGLSIEHVDMEWEEVTQVVKAASAELKVGEIIAPADFSLQEAMSAIELMDPKMDIGLGSANVFTLAEIEERGRLPKIDSLSPSNWLSLMDSLIIAEQMHYEGYHLALCILACYYMHDVERTLEKNVFLLNFARLLLRRAYYVRDCISRASNFYEEDYVHWSFGFDIGEPKSKTDDSDLTSATDALISSETEKLASITDEKLRKTMNAIILRLKWNRAMYLAQLHFSKPHNAGIADADKFMQEAISYIEEMKETSVLAENPENSCRRTAGGPDVVSAQKCTEEDLKKPKIWEYEIMRRWTNATPPAFQIWKCIEISLDSWKLWLEQMREITKWPEQIESIRDAKEMMVELTVEKKAALLVRARAVNVIWSEDKKFLGKQRVEDVLLQDLREQFGVGAKYAKADEKTLEFHMGLCVTGLSDQLRMMAMNRARARRRLPHIFDHWGTLLYDGDVLDSKVNSILRLSKDEEKSRGFARWHVDTVQGLISEFLTIGFELKLYERYEWPMIFWYLDNLAASRQKSHYKVLEAAEIHKQTLLHSVAKRGASSSRNPSSHKSASSPSSSPVDVKKNWYALELEAKFNLTRAIFLLIASLDAAGFLPLPPSLVSSPQTRYFLRFHTLINLSQPQGLRFSQFQSTYLDIVKDRAPSDLLQRASKAAQTAIRSFMELSNFSQPNVAGQGVITPPKTVIKESKCLLQISIKNGLSIAKLLKSNDLDHCKTLKVSSSKNAHNDLRYKPNSGSPSESPASSSPTNASHLVDLDFSSHRSFPIVSLLPKCNSPSSNGSDSKTEK